MKVTILGSGSNGNSTLVESGEVRLLIDAGFSGKELERRLAAVEVRPESLTAILITHDHADHTTGMGILARRWGLPLYLTELTRAACSGLLRGTEEVRSYRAEEDVEVGDLVIHPFLTIHDARDPIAVTVTERRTGQKLGIATDLGRPTEAVRHALRECHLLVLESNHDEVMLRESPYPWSVKSRIAGSHGHLSNRAAAELAAELHHPALCAVVLAHLSERSNDPSLARDVVGAALSRRRYRAGVQVAPQDRPLEPMDVGALRRRHEPAQLTLI